MLTNRIPAVSFIQFLFHSFFILVLNPWRRNCNLCLLKVQCGMWWFFILVLHRTFISHDCLFKIHVTAVWINWAVFQTTWHSIIYFIKIDGCCISGLSLKKTHNVWLSHTKMFYCYGVQFLIPYQVMTCD